MTIVNHIQTIGAPNHRLAMRDLKPLSGLSRNDQAVFWAAWSAITPQRRVEISHAMVELAEDNVDLDFSEIFLWCLDDEDAMVRTNAVDGLWENTSIPVLHRMLHLLEADPSDQVRASVAVALSRFAYLAELEELPEAEAHTLQSALRAVLHDTQQPLDVRRRSIESAGYFSTDADIQEQIEIAYQSDEQLLRESALVAMGRSMLPRWLPTIGQELSSPVPALRYEAARAAGEMAENAQSIVPKLVKLLNDDDSEVSFAAIWALGQIGGQTARRALLQVRKSPDEARRQAAIEALQELSLGEGSLDIF